jgi:hypothetical protein
MSSKSYLSVTFKLTAHLQSCGYAVPFFTYKAPRNRLQQFFITHESIDIAAWKKQESCSTNNSSEDTVEEPPEKGLRHYWITRNSQSLDGLPGILTAFQSKTVFAPPKPFAKQDDERDPAASSSLLGIVQREVQEVVQLRSLVTFLAGVAVTASYFKLARGAS